MIHQCVKKYTFSYDQKEYSKRYDGVVEKYEEVKDRLKRFRNSVKTDM